MADINIPVIVESVAASESPSASFLPDARILASEKIVGANHPTLADTKNRLANVEHNTDGTHKNASTLPWYIPVDVFDTAGSNTNWPSPAGINSNDLFNSVRATTGAQNATVSWPVVLAAGTWTITLIHDKGASAGIFTVKLDTIAVGTIDGYAGSAAYNNVSTIASISVTTTGKVDLSLTMATKNDLSGGYFGYVNGLSLLRTA